MRALLTAAKRNGLLLPPITRSIWVHSDSRVAYDVARPVLRGLQERFRRARWVFTSSDAETESWLRGRYIDDVTCMSPVAFAPAIRRFCRTLNPGTLVVLGSAKGLPPGVFTVAADRNVAIVYIVLTENDATDLEERFGKEVVDRSGWRFWACTEHLRRRLVERGIAVSQISCGSLADIESLAADVVPPEVRAATNSLLQTTSRDRLASGVLWQACAAFGARGRIDTWSELRARLGNPQTILCLGNGPSSEDPAVLREPHDVLFRVNHVWQPRARLRNPALVFVGSPLTLTKVRGCIYGFSTIRKESRMLLRRLWAVGPGRFEYITVERLSSLADETRWPAELSTGAHMIIAAAGLQPKRLVIAGVDLYGHPDGRYPGDTHASNTYAPDHCPETEVEAIAESLSSFPHEVVIFGDRLRDSLAGVRS